MCGRRGEPNSCWSDSQGEPPRLRRAGAIADISAIARLCRAEVITIGTPVGVGEDMSPSHIFADGDQVSISQMGTIINSPVASA